MAELTTEQRSEILQDAINQTLAFHRGHYKLTTQSATQATFTSGKRPNHILHLILSILTAGIWLIVWLILTMSNKERTIVVSVDRWGNVHKFDPSRGEAPPPQPIPSDEVTEF